MKVAGEAGVTGLEDEEDEEEFWRVDVRSAAAAEAVGVGVDVETEGGLIRAEGGIRGSSTSDAVLILGLLFEDEEWGGEGHSV